MRRRLTAPLAGLLLTLVAAAPVQAAPAGLAFRGLVSGQTDKAQLWVADQDGSSPRLVTANWTWDQSSPALSPDGTLIAYAEYPGKVAIVGVDGGTPVYVFDSGGGFVNTPRWAPNGDRLIFSAGAGTLPEIGIWTVAVDGTDPRFIDVGLPPGADNPSGPSLSADGELLTFVASMPGPNVNNSALFLANADGSESDQLTDPNDTYPGLNPRFSPDGGSIVFQEEGDVLAVDADNETDVRTIDDHADYTSTVDWSPDGGTIAFDRANRQFASNPFGADERPLIALPGPGGAYDRADQASFRQPDRVRPETTITAGPSGGTGERSPEFAFASERGATFACSVDGGAASACTSPTRIGPLAPGAHTFAVRATDAQGNVEDAPAVAGFEVVSAGEEPPQQQQPPVVVPLPAPLPPTLPVVRPLGPVLGVTAIGDVVKGTVLVKAPGSSRFDRLDGPAPIPVGATVDATDGTVRLVTASDCVGGTQSGDFWAGAFRIEQDGTCTPVTELVLARSAKKKKKKKKPTPVSAKSKKKKPARRLWGKGKGNFRTRTRHGTTTIRGTTWYVAQRCDGTVVRVREGVVSVRDLRRRRTVTVRSGGRYLARAARPTCPKPRRRRG